jgi:SAM-dependent methyltransferase
MDAAAWDARYAATDSLWGQGANVFLLQQIAGLTPGTALDLGCGEGRNTVELATRGWQATGIDFSATALDRARHLAQARHADVVWRLEDVTAWTPEETFHLILICYLHLPFPQRKAITNRALAAVAPGGSLLVIAHDIRNLREGVGGPQDPDLLWNPEELQADGFTALRRETARRPTASGIALDTVVHLQRP